MESVSDPHVRITATQKAISVIRPINRNGRLPVPVYLHRPINNSTTIFVVAADNKIDSGYRDWRFKTSREGIWAYYAEEWRNNSAGAWELLGLAMHLYLIEGRGIEQQKEIFAMHIEPRHAGNEIVHRCKRGPHVHVTADGNRLAHAHILLDFSDQGNTIRSLSTLESFLYDLVAMLECEIIQARR